MLQEMLSNSFWYSTSPSSGVTTWPQWKGRRFFQDFLWVIWTTEAGTKTFPLFRVCAFWLLLSQWYSCLAQVHLRGRGWTNFSPLFITEMANDHHLQTFQDFESLGTSICWICYDIAEQYWAAWGLSESVEFHVVVWVSSCVVLFLCAVCVSLLNEDT